MLFATATLASRLERAECRTCAAFGQIQIARGKDAFVRPIGGAAVVYGSPGAPFNKLAGLGFAAELDERELEEIEEEFRRRDAPLQVELSTLADPAVGALLTRRGYVLLNFENVLGLALDAAFLDAATRRHAEDEARGITVGRLQPDHAELWIEAMITGFANPDTFDGPPSHEVFSRDVLERAFREYGEVDGSVRYMAFRDGTLAGGGSARLDAGIAQLTGAATIPEHRRKGVQSALLRARLIDAARQGCDLATVTVQPGSKSMENAQRAGLSLLYPRAILVKQPRG
ncbi:MAG: GNAT family N-acetyltransferase [Vicinamibacterales bacterium]